MLEIRLTKDIEFKFHKSAFVNRSFFIAFLWLRIWWWLKMSEESSEFDQELQRDWEERQDEKERYKEEKWKK